MAKFKHFHFVFQECLDGTIFEGFMCLQPSVFFTFKWKLGCCPPHRPQKEYLVHALFPLRCVSSLVILHWTWNIKTNQSFSYFFWNKSAWILTGLFLYAGENWKQRVPQFFTLLVQYYTRISVPFLDKYTTWYGDSDFYLMTSLFYSVTNFR